MLLELGIGLTWPPPPREPSVYFKGGAASRGLEGKGISRARPRSSMNWGIWAPHGDWMCLGPDAGPPSLLPSQGRGWGGGG